MHMPRVIIVSNRLPVSVKKVDGKLDFYPSAGGLATGLWSYARTGKNLWIGWPGIASDDLSDTEQSAIRRELKKHSCYPIFLTQKQLDGFYNGYSNSVLWPLFHHLSVKTGDTSANWKLYREVNRLYCDVILRLSSSADRIWIHDYHLMVLPEMLRIVRPKGSIGFFLHIPFPESNVFMNTKHTIEITRGLLGADLIGMHTTRYVENYLDACRELHMGVVAPRKIVLPERIVRVVDLPIGIDYARFSDASKSLEVSLEHKKLQWKYRGKKVILTIDRLDPSKGLVGRLKAYRTLLAENPQLKGKVTMVMQAMPSRTEIKAYQKLRSDIEKLIADINSKFGTNRWQPVEVIFSALPFTQYAALYQRADVAFIAPIRDGMNLVAKEYLASHPKSDGILVLSETAGAAEELKDAVLVNPYNIRSLVGGLKDALNMTPTGFRRRARNMQRYLKRHTIDTWAEGFIGLLETPLPTPRMHRTRTISPAITSSVRADYRRAHHRLILIDYDGTLQPIVRNPKHATPSKDTLALLRRLSKDPRNHVVVISGRDKCTLTLWLGDLPITLVAEHGAWVRFHDRTHWKQMVLQKPAWKEKVQTLFDYYARISPGATIENKDWSIVWHYRNTPPYYAQKHLVALRRLLKPIAAKEKLCLQENKMNLEVMPLDISKAHSVQEWLLGEHDFVLAIGDDTTDEDMFKILPPMAHSVKVGRGRTTAGLRTASPDGVHTLLKNLLK